ncbi:MULTISPECIES: hypothetical protein [unclassified Brevundimonas]|uniref:hypothetical protein n=1 Tax=unclassified Brevundimonas TaxID=2622653 RepID=UPI002006B40D|nr:MULTISPECIES: hypothetical protein [unclassified Brevundimonas]MCK6104615.1 hypothetical protein [Brevundimonas sp. EYE_349]
MSFSATDAAFEGFRVVRRHPIVALVWGLTYLLLYVVMFGFGADKWANLMAAGEALEQSANPSIADFQALVPLYSSAFFLAAPLGIAIGTVLSAAVARSVLRPQESRWGYLRLGMDEVRVLVVTLATTLIVGLSSAVAMTVVGAAIGVGAASGQPLLILPGVLLIFAAFALVVWLAVKFSLAVPMTVDRRKVVILESFSATKGHFWPLLGMAVIAVIMSLIVSILGMIIGAAADLVTGGVQSLSRYADMGLAQVLANAWPALLLSSIVNAFLSALQLAVLYAPFSAAWQDIRALKGR